MAKPSQIKILKRILKQLKGYRLLLVASILLALISVAGSLIVPIFFGQIIDLIIGKGNVGFDLIIYKVFFIASVIAITAICQWLMNVINNAITYNVVKDVREEAFKKIQKLPLSYLDTKSTGDIVSRSVSDVDQFADGLLMGFTQLFSGVLTIIGTLVLMLVLNWIIALVVVVLTPISLFVAKFIATKTHALFKKTAKIRGEQTAFVDEMIGNLKVVQAFGHEDENVDRFNEINERYTKASLNSIFFSSLVNPSTRFVNAIVYAAVALSGAITLIYPNLLPIAFSVGGLSTLLSYANQYTKPFNEISGVVTELQNAIACAGRIYEIIDEPSESCDRENALTLINPEGEVEFNSVYFSYVSDKKLIENFNFKAKKGQRIAIVGPTGCGKTTLINLLMRFYDVNEGKICVDGNNINEITRKSLRSNYGMVLQDTWLKSGTVKENIAMGNPNATDEEIIAAAKAAHSHKFIMQMANGYDTFISEDGGNLSQGQKQLLCITRIMLTLPPMLILDEATSSIDTRTEQRIQRAFAKMMKGRTSFIVAHRLSTIKEADVILVMKDGNVIEQGNHDELIKKGGFYCNLYNSQFAH
ncbi:MAG: ABC transporter ATP-binding protein [Clostridia bacterium]|nr:ABC transporter ATP-binding protein [Clostridia bacterium]